ncbi:DUF1559 domain-containing protein [Bremerella cremea]|uniref:DUF1559 domain-containing protein n=1 Tax=Bremerella cremea TaxID=1031537 RepID=A0A368KRD6_9BACT|nr:DUF1559 domain-containing protein [Bremerella cremea]RCS49366.1 DUF1559 domain-containing protein [Bremerella cremea]
MSLLIPKRLPSLGRFALALILGCFASCNSSNSEKLETIALATSNYQDTFNQRPPILVTDADGKPLHSWRVLILPFIEANSFWDEYDNKAAWNDPTNDDLVDGKRHHPGDKFPYPANVGKFYQSGNSSHSQETRFVVLVSGPLEAKPYQNDQIAYYVPDSQPLIVLEVESSGIHWMEPRDIAGATADQPTWNTLADVKPKIVRSIEINSDETTIREREETASFLDALPGLGAVDSNPA